MRYLHTIVQPNTDLVASASITPIDLPVNPLSFLLLRFQITRTAPIALLLFDTIDDLITQITGVRILHRGEQIISGSLRDLMILNAVYQGAYPGWDKAHPVGAAIDTLVFPICLGKDRYNPLSCFPATSRGNLRFEMDAGADGAGYTDVNFSIEAIELIEATPKEYVKYVRQARDSVIGQFDAPLPIGNPLLGILLFDTAIQTLQDGTSSWGTIKLLKDNVEQYYPLSDFETLAGMLRMFMGDSFILNAGHVHKFVAADALASMTDTAATLINTGARGYAYLDFDPLRDDSYTMDTAGAADLKIRGQGDVASAVRYYPLEEVTIA